MDYDYKIIEEKLKQLPLDVQVAFTSPEIAEAVKAIGDRHGLKLDAEAILFDLTGYILLGLIPSSEFVSKFSKETGITEKESALIAVDVNKEIFGHIKEMMQKREAEERELETDEYSEDSATTTAAADISHLEQAGNFNMEKTGDEDNKESSGVPADLENKESILDGIENPSSGQAKISRKEDQNYSEPLIDHLLQTPTSQPQQKTTEKPAINTGSTPSPATTAPQPPSEPRANDPYRETPK